MTLTPFSLLSLFGRITPADALAESGASYTLGLQNENLASLLPTGEDAPDVLYTRQFTLGAGLTKAVNMQTLQITTIDSTQPLNADGDTFTLTKIFAILLRLVSVDTDAADSGLRLSNNVWSHHVGLRVDSIEGVGLLFWPDGVTVAGGDTCNLVQNGGSYDVVAQLLVIGRE